LQASEWAFTGVSLRVRLHVHLVRESTVTFGALIWSLPAVRAHVSLEIARLAERPTTLFTEVKL